MENKIFNSLFQIVNFFNDPKKDSLLLKEAGIKEDKNILPIIVRVGMKNSISVGELANQLGKSHSSTSRQIDKFEKQKLLKSVYNKNDKRIREIHLTETGKKIYKKIQATRYEMYENIFKNLNDEEIRNIDKSLNYLVKLLKGIN